MWFCVEKEEKILNQIKRRDNNIETISFENVCFVKLFNPSISPFYSIPFINMVVLILS